jgi:hypothetical protein
MRALVGTLAALVFCLVGSTSVFSEDIRAVTSDGREVLLHPDGTWTWAEDNREGAAENEDERFARERVYKEIDEHCLAQWTDDYTMRLYCIEQAREAAEKLVRLMRDTAVPADVRDGIFARCRSQWTKDWLVIEYCAQQQIEAWRKLNR